MNRIGKSAPFQTLLDEAELQLDPGVLRSIGQQLSRLNLTVSVAESLTGGLVCQRLSEKPGASAYFTGGVVCYSPKQKIQLCGVNPSTIRENGVVSQKVAIEMAIGIKRLMKTDIGIATTGYAGPDPDMPDRVGTVFVGFSLKSSERVKGFKLDGSRSVIRENTALAALSYLHQYLLNFDEF